MRRDVGVVIVSFNSADVLHGLLSSIPEALGRLTASIVIVDNGSTDDSLEVIGTPINCTVIQSTNTGYAGGINVGIRSLDDVETILVLNPDVRLHPGSVETMFDTLQSQGFGIVAPRVLEPDGRLFRSLRREPTLLRAIGLGSTGRPLFDEYISDPESYETRQVVDWALGAALLIRREVDTALGGWDESFFLYSEETDLALRAADHGWSTVYEPAAVVTHIGGASGRSARTHTMQILNRVRLYTRHHSTLAAATYFGLALLAEASRLLRGNGESRLAIEALLLPARRPPELNCSGSYLPR